MSTTASSLPTAQDFVFLHAYIECSDTIQQGIQEMLRIVFDPESTADEKRMAIHTAADALYPNLYKGQMGMDLEESEADAAQETPELMEMVQEMSQQEDAFAVRLRQLMDDRGLTQADVAARIGVGQPAISNMLNRQCRPQRRTIERLSEALGVSPSDLWPGFAN